MHAISVMQFSPIQAALMFMNLTWQMHVPTLCPFPPVSYLP
jgi:hypothetical protein